MCYLPIVMQADPLVAPRELGGLHQPSHSGRQQLDMPGIVNNT